VIFLTFGGISMKKIFAILLPLVANTYGSDEVITSAPLLTDGMYMAHLADAVKQKHPDLKNIDVTEKDVVDQIEIGFSQVLVNAGITLANVKFSGLIQETQEIINCRNVMFMLKFGSPAPHEKAAAMAKIASMDVLQYVDVVLENVVAMARYAGMEINDDNIEAMKKWTEQGLNVLSNKHAFIENTYNKDKKTVKTLIGSATQIVKEWINYIDLRGLLKNLPLAMNDNVGTSRLQDKIVIHNASKANKMHIFDCVSVHRDTVSTLHGRQCCTSYLYLVDDRITLLYAVLSDRSESFYGEANILNNKIIPSSQGLRRIRLKADQVGIKKANEANDGITLLRIDNKFLLNTTGCIRMTEELMEYKEYEVQYVRKMLYTWADGTTFKCRWRAIDPKTNDLDDDLSAFEALYTTPDGYRVGSCLWNIYEGPQYDVPIRHDDGSEITIRIEPKGEKYNPFSDSVTEINGLTIYTRKPLPEDWRDPIKPLLGHIKLHNLQILINPTFKDFESYISKSSSAK
jgi:hypothetical protein